MWCGTYSDALIDLWSKEEGRSDLVLRARITEVTDGISVKLHMVHVP